MGTRQEGSLGAQVAQASKWSALSEIAARAITPFVFVVLARLLTPEDFGVVAIAAIVISFSQVFWEAGLSKALIQRQGEASEIDRVANVVFWTNIALGLVIYGLLFAAAGWIAALFGDPRAAPVIRVQGLQIIVAALTSVHVALYQRALDFRTLFWVRVFTVGVPGLASIPLAWLGYGYWALVAGTVFGSLAQLIVLWCKSPWRPSPHYDAALARQLGRFGLWVSAEGLLAWGFLWVDVLIVGAFLGAHDLGLYRTGNVFLGSAFALLLSPVLPVLYSSFARLQHDRKALVETLLKVNKLLAMIALPLGVGAFLLAGPLADLIFAAKWRGIAPVIGILGLTQAIGWLFGANEQAYRAMGRPDINPKVIAGWLAFYIPAYLLAAPYGLVAFLWTRLALEVIAQPIVLLVAQRVLGLTLDRVLKEYGRILGAAAAMAVVVSLAEKNLPDGMQAWLRCSLLISAGAGCYGLLVYRAERTYVRSVVAQIAARLRPPDSW
jgi:O-antigen/teichoic acid export membrane protein